MRRGPWYSGVFQRLGVKHEQETFGRRSRVESVFSSYKQRSKVFYKQLQHQLPGKAEKKDKHLWWRRALQQANFFAFTFIIYNNLR